MNTYYEVQAQIDGCTDYLFGSFVKTDCTYEIDAERDSWKDQGYTQIKIVSRETDQEPDLDVYADNACEICGKLDELGHNDATGLALCSKCDDENQDDDDEPAAPEAFHYYAACALGWATDDTREKAIRKLVDDNYDFFKSGIKPAQKRGDAGAYVWACKVHAPADAHYDIEFYAPVGVEKSEGAEHFITHLTRKEIAFTNRGQS